MILDEMSEIEILALTILGEARGEPIEGQIAVGCVIRNRAEKRKQSYPQVCFAPKQFSCWNGNDPNRQRLINIATTWRQDVLDNNMEEQIKYVAQGIYNDILISNVGLRDHYMTLSLFRDARPSWATNATDLKIIGRHIFFSV